MIYSIVYEKKNTLFLKPGTDNRSPQKKLEERWRVRGSVGTSHMRLVCVLMMPVRSRARTRDPLCSWSTTRGSFFEDAMHRASGKTGREKKETVKSDRAEYMSLERAFPNH